MDTLDVISLLDQVKTSNEEPKEKKPEEESEEMTKTCNTVREAIRKAGIDEQQLKYAMGEQWVAKVVSAVVEQIVGRPQLFQTMVDAIIDRIKARL